MHEPVPASAAPAGACALCGGTARRRVFGKRGWTFVRCRACGLVSLDRVPTLAQIEAYHEASYAAGAYATFAAADAMRAAIASYRLDALRPLAAAGPWLDVGCSTGAFVAAVAGAGLSAEGLELSATAVAQARARGLTVHQGAVEHFEPPHRYAVVTAFDVVEHLPDPRAFLARVGSWLTPGGLLGLTLPDIASPTARLMGRSWFYYAPPDHVHYFTPATITRLLEGCGFRDTVVQPARKPMSLAYATGAVAQLMPALGPAVRVLAGCVPAALRTRIVPLPLGEMHVIARAG